MGRERVLNPFEGSDNQGAWARLAVGQHNRAGPGLLRARPHLAVLGHDLGEAFTVEDDVALARRLQSANR